MPTEIKDPYDIFTQLSGQASTEEWIKELQANLEEVKEDPYKKYMTILAIRATTREGGANCLEAISKLCPEALFAQDNSYKKTPAHLAAIHGFKDCLMVLLSCAPQTFKTEDYLKKTPINWLEKKQHPKCESLLKVLLEYTTPVFTEETARMIIKEVKEIDTGIPGLKRTCANVGTGIAEIEGRWKPPHQVADTIAIATASAAAPSLLDEAISAPAPSLHK